MDFKLINDVWNFFFGFFGVGGLDLVVININRGREWGLFDFNLIWMVIGLLLYDFF